METRSNYIIVGAVTMALLAGMLLFIVWLAGLSNKTTKSYDIYFSQAVGGLTRGPTSPSPACRSARSSISLLPEPARIRLGADRGRRANTGSSRHHRADPRRRLHRRHRNPARRCGARKAADQAVGAARLSGCSREHWRARSPAQQRAGAHRPHPTLDGAADRAAQRQEPEFHFRYSRERRPHHQGVGRPFARNGGRDRTNPIAAHNAGIAAANVAALTNNTTTTSPPASTGNSTTSSSVSAAAAHRRRRRRSDRSAVPRSETVHDLVSERQTWVPQSAADPLQHSLSLLRGKRQSRRRGEGHSRCGDAGDSALLRTRGARGTAMDHDTRRRIRPRETTELPASIVIGRGQSHVELRGRGPAARCVT